MTAPGYPSGAEPAISIHPLPGSPAEAREKLFSLLKTTVHFFDMAGLTPEERMQVWRVVELRMAGLLAQIYD